MTMLNRLIPERWRQRKVAAEKPIAPKPSPDDPERMRAALESSDPVRRRAVLARIDDPTVLQRLSREDDDAGVRDAAQTRLCKLIEGGEDDASLPLEARHRALAAVLSPQLAERFAVGATEPTLRIAALQGVECEAFCAERAVTDPVARVREAALARVNDPQYLADIARRARKRDKQISRNARDRWQRLMAEQQRQQAIEDICVALDALEWDGETGRNAARFAQLEQSWQAVAGMASPEQQARYRQAHERFQAQLRASAAQRRSRAQLCQQLDELVAQLQAAAEPTPETDTAIRLLPELEAAWAALEPADDPENRRLQRHFDEQRAAVTAREQSLRQHARQCDQRRRVIARGEALLRRAGQLASADLQRFEADWQQLPTLPGSTMAELQGRYAQTRHALHERLAAQVEARSVEQAALDTVLEQLEHTLTTGELQQAIDLQNRAQQLLAENIGLDRRQMDDFRQRLQSCAPRIAQLRDWRRWGTNRSRESLIDEVEQLGQRELEPSALAEQVQQARRHWQSMDQTGGMAPRPLRRRFEQACERAYQPVRAWREAQSEQRRRNLAARQSLCEQIEQRLTVLETPDGDDTAVDWRELSRFEQQLQQQWRQAGPVERRQHKAVERRFREAMNRLQARLQPVLEQDLQRRRQLIEQARSLADVEDSRAAVETVKRLQTEWQPRVLASRRREQALWKQFRTACDAVFANREAQRNAQRAEHKTGREQREALLNALEELTTRLDSIELGQADERFAALCAEWEGLETTVKTRSRDGRQRFDECCRAFEQARNRIDRHHMLARLRQLQARAEPCMRAEQLAEHWLARGTQPDTTELERLQADRMNGEPLDDADLEALFQHRFEQAMQALREPPAVDSAYLRTLRTGLDMQQQRCLQLEVLLGLESPPEFARDRLQFRVAQLSESLGEREQSATLDDRWSAALELARDVCLQPLPAELPLVERWRRIQDALAARA